MTRHCIFFYISTFLAVFHLNNQLFCNSSENGTAIRFRNTCYFISNGKKAVFPDRYTMETMGFKFDNIRSVTRHELSTFPDVKEPMKTKWDHHSNKKMLSLGYTDSIKGVQKVFNNLLNPCFIYWNNFIAVSWRYNEGNIRIAIIDSKVIDTLYASGIHLEHKVNTASKRNMNAHSQIKRHISVLKHIDFKNDSLMHVDMPGEDPRLITIINNNSTSKQQSLWVAYCQRYAKASPEIWMSYAEVLLINETSLKLDYIANINFKIESPKDQKNWSPFIVNSTHMLFIQSINPHRIVHIIKTNMKQHVFGESIAVSHSNKSLSTLWPYGELRGGTPALYIEKDGHFLTFFHSSNIPPRTGDVLQTYTMGAYTFCPKYPYNILKMSPKPMVHETMYSGNWTYLPISYYHIDYVVFPMSFIIDGNDIFVTYGKQDKEGWIMRLDYKKLIDSLVEISPSCE